MKIIIFLTTFLFLISSKSHSIQIITECVSESGQSSFEIFFQTKDSGGLLDYKYMKQDIRYIAYLEPIRDNKIFGRAEFWSSKSGETKGNPFDFVLDLENKTFTENIEYKCE